MDDAVSIALIMRAPFRRRFGVFTTARVATELCVGRKDLSFDLFQFLSSAGHNLIWIVFSTITRLIKLDTGAGFIHQLEMFIHGINPAIGLDRKRGD